jgi:hypothetical protein
MSTEIAALKEKVAALEKTLARYEEKPSRP